MKTTATDVDVHKAVDQIREELRKIKADLDNAMKTLRDLPKV